MIFISLNMAVNEQPIDGLPFGTGKWYDYVRCDYDTIQQWLDGFVDDTSLFVNILGNKGVTNDDLLLHDKLEQDMLLWKELL
jgi:hypothetical protein